MDTSEKAFISQSEFYLDHEVRIRMNEEVNKDIRNTMHAMNDKIDAQLKWILGTLGAIFSAIFIPISLHALKLI